MSAAVNVAQVEIDRGGKGKEEDLHLHPLLLANQEKDGNGKKKKHSSKTYQDSRKKKVSKKKSGFALMKSGPFLLRGLRASHFRFL